MSRVARMGCRGRFSTLLSCFLFGVLVLAGCNTPDQLVTLTPTTEPTMTATIAVTPSATFTPQPTATPVPVYANVDVTALDGMKIRVWHGFRDRTKEVFDALVKTFNDKNDYGIRIFVESAVSDAGLDDRLHDVNLAEEQPNLIFSTEDRLRDWETGRLLLAPLNDYFSHPTDGLADATRDAIDRQFPTSAKRTRFPMWQNPYYLFYNDTFGQQLGFSAPPATFEEFTNQACAGYRAVLQDDDPKNDGTGGWILSFAPGTAMSWMLALGDDAAGQVGSTIDFTDEATGQRFLRTVTALRELFDDSCVWQSRLPEPYGYFVKHEALFYSGTTADIAFQRQAFADSEVNSNDDWRMISYPGVNGDDQSVFAETVMAGIVVQTPEEQFASWLFLNWLLEPERWVRWTNASLGVPILPFEELPAEARKGIDRKVYTTLHDAIEPVWLDLPDHWITIKAVLGDGFKFSFGATSTVDSIPIILEQVLQTMEEIETLDSAR